MVSESHHRRGIVIRDCIIGFADGLTVPFALTAGLFLLGSTRLVVLAGLAELFAGSVSMGLGAWLAAITDAKYYDIEHEKKRREVQETPAEEEEEMYGIFSKFGIEREECRIMAERLKRDEEMWVLFMMRFELRLEKPFLKGAWVEGLVMGISYFVGSFALDEFHRSSTITKRETGGLLPMIPYFILKQVNHALFVSIGITFMVLLAFGYAKAMVIGAKGWDAGKSAIQTLIVGALAATVSYGIVRGFNTVQEL
ncbi:Vacuolar iron transporter [Acrodontium crateriforme]|uniref:Vacuolar iron transporter n=1 Tax=Acrodontium crateriforme TaxID=150365 RepID=A0AAQ3RD34_9PEZI|nr:Vacuolar iron transporter [Acrodontium crateriforme]